MCIYCFVPQRRQGKYNTCFLLNITHVAPKLILVASYKINQKFLTGFKYKKLTGYVIIILLLLIMIIENFYAFCFSILFVYN